MCNYFSIQSHMQNLTTKQRKSVSTRSVTVYRDYHHPLSDRNQSHKMWGIITSQKNSENSKNVFIQNFIGNQERYEKPSATTKNLSHFRFFNILKGIVKS